MSQVFTVSLLINDFIKTVGNFFVQNQIRESRLRIRRSKQIFEFTPRLGDRNNNTWAMLPFASRCDFATAFDQDAQFFSDAASTSLGFRCGNLERNRVNLLLVAFVQAAKQRN